MPNDTPSHPVLLLNSPVLTAPGQYRLRRITCKQACALVQNRPYVSAIGHKATAEVMSSLLGIQIPFARVGIEQQPGQIAIVLRLLKRPPEGVVLTTRAELNAFGYEFARLDRLPDSDESASSTFRPVD